MTGAPDEPGLEGLEDARARLRAAIESADEGELAALFAGDLTVVHVSGQVETKESFIRSLRSQRLAYRGLRSVTEARYVLGSGAVVTGTNHIEVTSEGRDASFDVRFVHVWTREPSGWRLLVNQSTRVR